LTIALVLSGILVASAASGETREILNFRAFGEAFNTPSAVDTRDQSYAMLHGRLRGGFELKNERFSVLALLQAAGTTGIPDNGAFGIGPVYYRANHGDPFPGGKTNYGKVSAIEFFAKYQTPAFKVLVGRTKFASSAEAKTGVKYLDWVKKRRLAERLIGNWDWVNVGRRYDGIIAGFGGKKARIDAFGLRPLKGGINYQDAYEWFTNLAVYGGSVTSLYNQLIPYSEVQAFYYYYDDSREGAHNVAGGDIKVSTVGGSWLLGDDRNDLLGWFAYQFGDWGVDTQEGIAFLVEVGRSAGSSGKFRLGYAQASGDNGDADGKHKTFFNLLPTNHKWYGAMDYNAFQNLRTLYITYNHTFNAQWSGRAALHGFNLANPRDTWYGGSGAFSDDLLGYVPRVVAGNYQSSKIGQELDIEAAWKFKGNHKLAGGGGIFWGDKAAGQFLTVDKNGLWGYLQLILSI
jgi:hypothetical protein